MIVQFWPVRGVVTIQNITNQPLSHLSYFVEWGGKSWENLLAIALQDFLGEDIQGKKVLELGPGRGKMSCLFALLGADVTGVDTNASLIMAAKAEAQKMGVQDKIQSVLSLGTLDVVPDNAFDVVFARSVLVMIPELEGFLKAISTKLKPGGKIVFLENAYGNLLIYLLRYAKHGKWMLSEQANYFTERQVSMVNKIFDVRLLKKTSFPPVYLFCGYKRS